MRIFKHIFGFIMLSAFAMYLMGLAPTALAADTMPNANDLGFCNRINSISNQLNSSISTKQNDISSVQNKATSDIANRRQDFDKRLNSERTEWDQRRADQYKALSQHAKTDAQKTAVENYKTSIETAINLRRNAVNLAISTYRQAVDSLLGAHQNDATSVATDFQKQVQQAISAAQAQCQNGAGPIEVHKAFIATLQQAHQKLDTDRQSVDQVKEQITSLDQTKRLSIDSAINQFKQSAEAAAQALRASFGGDQSFVQPSLINSL